MSESPLVIARALERAYARRRAVGGGLLGGVLPDRAEAELRAVDRVDLDIFRGETLAVVGESGSGKSTLARLLTVLERPDAGRIEFDGIDLLAARGSELRRLRRRFQLVFQDSAAALDPRATVATSVGEALRAGGMGSRTERRRRIEELLADVDLDPALASRWPHQLSGGQRQRIAIARALATEPELLVLDEPVSALDAVVRERILDLLRDLRRRLGLTVLFIGHDLGVISRIADRAAVMKDGRIVELGSAARVFGQPEHPYTRELIAAIPSGVIGKNRPLSQPESAMANTGVNPDCEEDPGSG